jgi:hypothetical protein
MDVACGNIVLLTVRFLDVAKFTILTPLSLLISCKLSFPIVGLKMPSLPTFALKSPLRKYSYVIQEIYQIHVPTLCRSCPSHQFYPLLEQECSE